ncbi:IclR family transcriptional regulator [Leucobacter sp. PH1c]|uniref:IclR family transcriptional regulator n=1 Tax=Leucobacter sp. PH1c TaxID=1397278 RepID=UPI0004694553|nr:IclR family transcriptional regulator [Leucobacter sp. PH1c]
MTKQQPDRRANTELELPALNDGPSPILSVDRALRVLTCLADFDTGGEALGVIAARLGEDKASVHRSLNALKHRFFAVQDPDTGNYALGPAALGIADTFISRDGMRPMLHRALLTVCTEVNETAHAAIPEGRFVRYIDKVEPDRDMRVSSYIGARYEMRRTALGRAILSVDCQGPEELGRFLGDDPSALWPRISEAAARGYAVEHEENEPGITCVSVPVLFAGRAIAAVSVSAPSSRMVGRLDEIGRVIREALTDELTAGFSLPDPR